MLVQEAGDLPPQRGDVGQVADGTRTIEELSLQLFRYGVPLHDDRRSQAAKNVLFRGGEGAGLPVLLRSMQGFLEILRQPFLVVGQRREAALPLTEFRCFLRVTRLGQLSKFRCSRAIVLGRKHSANLPLRPELLGFGERQWFSHRRCTMDMGTTGPISEASAEL